MQAAAAAMLGERNLELIWRRWRNIIVRSYISRCMSVDKSLTGKHPTRVERRLNHVKAPMLSDHSYSRRIGHLILAPAPSTRIPKPLLTLMNNLSSLPVPLLIPSISITSPKPAFSKTSYPSTAVILTCRGPKN